MRFHSEGDPRVRRRIRASVSFLAPAIAATLAAAGEAQTVARILDQNPESNNLVDPPGYEVGRLGTLGKVEKSGSGTRAMLLIPGLGFGGEVFDGFMEGWDETFTRYVVTLPGMGGTPAPPSPPPDVSFGDQTWTQGALEAIGELMERERLFDAVVVGHWLTGTQIALRLAHEHPDRVSAVILPAGSARWVTAQEDPAQPDSMPIEQRAARVDSYLAPQWFKTVTRETWDDNNFLPGDYSANPVLGLRLWREAARPSLHVWIRYLSEFYAQDATFGLDELEIPVLLLKPGLEGLYFEGSNNYVYAYTDRGWGRWAQGAGSFAVLTIPRSRIVPWADRPELVDQAVEGFLGLERASVPEGDSDRPWIFRNVRVFDGDQVHQRVDVVVVGSRIQNLGTDLPIPNGARVVEGQGRTLLPGLIDSHTHTTTPEMLRDALRFGVTTSLDQFTLPSTVAQVNAREKESPGAGASLFSAGIVATAPGGHPTQLGAVIPTLETPDEAATFVAERVEEGSRWLKIVWDDGATHGVSLPMLDARTVQALITAAHAQGLKAVVHIATAQNAIAALSMGADGLVHTVQEATLDDDFGQRVAEAGGFVVPTLTVIRSVSGEAEGAAQLEDEHLSRLIGDAKRTSLTQTISPRPGARSSGAVAVESVRSLHEAGVAILAGTDAPNPGTAPGVTMHRELELLVQAGLTPTEALAAATANPARAFGLDDRGRIAPGLRADLLLVEGDPSRRILHTRRILGVWKAGVRVSGK